MTPREERLVDGHHWYRVADSEWVDPLDPAFAMEHGGRWNPSGSFLTLYLNHDLPTARAQIYKLLDGSPVEPDDLADGFDLVVATLPRSQVAADAVSPQGLEALGLPATYPLDDRGRIVSHAICQSVGEQVQRLGLRGVSSRSSVTNDGFGRELAWFPARKTSKATLLNRRRFGDWWYQTAV